MGGRYRLVERIGTGGMSVVWRGHDEVLGRRVAVKVLASGFAHDTTFRERMRREARAAARLCHPQVSTVYDLGGYTDSVPYVVMELIDGPTLAEEMVDGPLPWRHGVEICAEVAAALAAVHRAGLVHRDVKPANIMLGSTGAKLVDFGISAEIGEYADGSPNGTVLGTPAYVAPERLRGGPALPASDVYALGVLLYKALTGHLPWAVDTKAQVLRAHLAAPPAPLPPLDGMPPEVAELCERCLAKAPSARPDAHRLVRVWSRAVHGPVVEDPTLTLPISSRRRLRPLDALRVLVNRPHRLGLVAAGAVGALALTLTTAFSIAPDRTATDPETGATPPVTAALAGSPMSCRVTYRLRSDDGHSFIGELTVRNTGDNRITGGTLAFTLPGNQQVTGPGEWTQSGSAVRVAAPALDPGGEQVLPFRGTYHGANPLPSAFSLGETACDPVMIGVTNPGQNAGTRASPDGRPAKDGGKGKGSGNGRN
jgi:serine/threonine-protein kinase